MKDYSQGCGVDSSFMNLIASAFERIFFTDSIIDRYGKTENSGCLRKGF